MQLIYQKIVKRPMDFVLALLAMIILAPLLLFLALLVNIKIGRPVLFKQKRPGLNEKIFTLYKFRSMTNDRDSKGNLLAEEQRLTNFGKKLRASSLDELPELLNIIKGDMSIVGPRPLLVEYLPLYNAEQKRRHAVRPGLTGHAQVNGRNEISWEKKFKLDVDYVDQIHFLGDVKIILKTIRKVFQQAGINADSETSMESFTGNNGN